MKIYTKSGDDGTTGLIGGQRISKSDGRIECYGTVDELNATIGWAATVANSAMIELLRPIQNELFVIGSHLAMPDDPTVGQIRDLPALDEETVGRLERQIDSTEKSLPPLRQFILPGGCELAARLHIARTICRRAERSLVLLMGQRQINRTILTYLNRLSDWLFVQAREANLQAGIADIPWTK